MGLMIQAETRNFIVSSQPLKINIQGIFMPIFKEMIHNGNQEEHCGPPW